MRVIPLEIDGEERWYFISLGVIIGAWLTAGLNGLLLLDRPFNWIVSLIHVGGALLIGYVGIPESKKSTSEADTSE